MNKNVFIGRDRGGGRLIALHSLLDLLVLLADAIKWYDTQQKQQQQ